MARGRHLSHHPRALRPRPDRLSPLGHPQRRARSHWRRRFQGGARPLPSLRFARLPVGSSHADFSEVEAARTSHLCLHRRSLHGRKRMGFAAPDGTISPGSTPDDLYEARYLYEIYTARANRALYGDESLFRSCGTSEACTIVNNESSEIIRMFNSAFDQWGDASLDFYPPICAPKSIVSTPWYIDTSTTACIRCGFATTQAAYDRAFDSSFARSTNSNIALRIALPGRSADHRGRLATVHHAGPLRRGLLRALQMQSAAHRRLSESVELPARVVPGAGRRRDRHLEQIKRHYYASHATINPTRIVPKGPAIDFSAPHDRDANSPERADDRHLAPGSPARLRDFTEEASRRRSSPCGHLDDIRSANCPVSKANQCEPSAGAG